MDATGGIGMGANVVGGLMKAIAAGIASQNMKQALAAELQRAEASRNEALDVFQPALENRSSETATKEISKGKEKREKRYAEVGATRFGTGPTFASSRDQAAYKLRGMARARLSGYSDWSLDQAIAHIRAQDSLNKISNFAAGTASIFPYRMSDAQHSGDQLAFLGNLVQSVGGNAGNWSEMFGTPPSGEVGGFGSRVPGSFGDEFNH